LDQVSELNAVLDANILVLVCKILVGFGETNGWEPLQ
jgi:hypothetical protein